ncbi:MAG: hypothetical protein JSR80_01270 [Verrucomicrobia bacterium]|nr:hypothetical protein [Verrucomicrobiota bacterium]
MEPFRRKSGTSNDEVDPLLMQEHFHAPQCAELRELLDLGKGFWGSVKAIESR